MSDIIERICKDLYSYAEKKHFNGEVELANGILKAKCYIEDEKEKYEELAKEPQECNSDLISKRKLIDSFNASINTGYETFSYDLIVEAINNQPQVQPIVRSTEEIAEILKNSMDCAECRVIHDMVAECDDGDCMKKWINWLTKKEV